MDLPTTSYSDDPRVLQVSCGWSCTTNDGTVYYLKPLLLCNGATANTTAGGVTAIIGWELVSADRSKRLEFLECVSPDRAFETVLGQPQTSAMAEAS